MFGGAGVYRDRQMFALVADGAIFLKSDKDIRPQFVEAGCRPFVFEKRGKPVATSYWSLPEYALDDAEALKFWVDLACAAARRNGKRREPP